MSTDVDAQFISNIIDREGGFVNHPADKGGPTKYGVTLKTYCRHELGSDPLPEEAPRMLQLLKAMPREKAAEILRFEYVTRPGFDHLDNDLLRSCVLDASVHSGPAQAIKMLQRALDVEDDGILGHVTLTKANGLRGTDVTDACIRFLCERQRFIGKIVSGDPTQAVFLNGWTERCMAQIEAILKA